MEARPAGALLLRKALWPSRAGPLRSRKLHANDQAAFRQWSEAGAAAPSLQSSEAPEEALVEESTLQNWRSPLHSLTRAASTANQPLPRCIVALGKFDAMHLGHRSLVERAAGMGGEPWLISFDGMAAELGWTQRLPLVAPRQRPRVLCDWSAACGGSVPRLRTIPFAAVRQLSPRDFVDALANDLQAAGVVVGRNYRFGYKASGTSDTLRELGAAFGVDVAVMDLLGEPSNEEGTVSSSEVRKALGDGRVDLVAQWLGRPYTLVAANSYLSQQRTCGTSEWPSRVQLCDFENQPPGVGRYDAKMSPAEVPTSTCQIGMDDDAAVEVQYTWEPHATPIRVTCIADRCGMVTCYTIVAGVLAAGFDSVKVRSLSTRSQKKLSPGTANESISASVRGMVCMPVV